MASTINEFEVLKMKDEMAALLSEVERLKRERDELAKYYNEILINESAKYEWHLITRKKPSHPIIVYDPFYGKLITCWQDDHWRGYHFIDPLYWSEIPPGPHDKTKWYPQTEKPKDGTRVLIKTIETATYDEKRDMWAMDEGEISCHWRYLLPTTPPPTATE